MLRQEQSLLRISSCMLALLSLVFSASAEERPIRIGVLNDMSGIYADFGGPSSVVAAKMAVQDFGGKIGDRKIEVLSGDHLNKADVGSIIARRWFDQDAVDAIVDVPTSSVALAVSEIVREKNKI